jgi:integrase
MFRAFRFVTDAGPYWSVVDDECYQAVEIADRFLQHVRFSRGRAESTTRKYAEAIALYHNFCFARSASWANPDMAAFQMWLRVAPSPRHPYASSGRVWPGPGCPRVRGDNHIKLITYAVCEMFRFAAAESMWDEAKLSLLFELLPVQSYSTFDRRRQASRRVVVRRRHRLKTRPGRRRDAPVEAVKDILARCLNTRDVLFIAMLATTGLRRGEALGLRLSDLHFLPNSALLGCDVEGAHLHVVPRSNSNHAKVKNAKRRVVPVPAGLVGLYDHYRADRDACRQAQESDYVFVNLYRAPLGEPMKLHAANALLSRLSRRAGHRISPHMLRHTFGTNAAQSVSVDVVAELLGHANLQSTQTYLHPDVGRQRGAIEAGALAKHLESLAEK